ncbi:MAG: tRNA pseudouridine(13) synthase TruD [Candidatus Heimdallarchaeaceae archaeon]|jgi:tRNA pseudouridine13 synthase
MQEISNILRPIFTQSMGIGGEIKQKPEDFIVSEILENHQILDPRKDVFDLPGKTGLFLHFVLIKRDIDTSAALDWISKLWNIPRDNINLAGSKDKKALTAQRASIWGAKELFESGKIKEINLPTFSTKSLSFRLREIRLGDLWGNAFDITIRDISHSSDVIRETINSVMNEINENGGVLNSYGIQRFGEVRPVTHLVGKELLKGDIKQAIKLYVGKVFENEPTETKEARSVFWENEDIKTALDLFPSHLSIERKMLVNLIKRKKDYKQVFLALPRQFQKLFIHAFQSYLFNRYLKIRYEEYSKNFEEPISGEISKERNIYAPIVGFKTELSGEVEEIYSRLFEVEDVKIEDFQNNFINKIGGKGTFRSITFMPKKFELNEIKQDDLNENQNKARISFEIQKGSYATELLRELMKDNGISST